MTTTILDRLADRFAIPIALIALVVFIVAGRNSYSSQWQGLTLPSGGNVTPEEGVELPVVWGDLGKRLVESGAIDREKFVSLYGELSAEEAELLDGNSPERIRITRENAPYLLNLLWAFGLANKNPILEDKTEMMNPAYGGAGGFASTGGWTLARGDAMDHYNRHSFVVLSPERQRLVERVSKGIFRPCCDNSTHFPDCNHGMAMLGLLELMASQGTSEQEMWDAALAVNSYWFPDTYQTIALYKQQKGIAWENVSPQEALGVDYSSASGYARVSAEVAEIRGESGVSCSV
ncbi:hypothetical protein A3A39_01060 [Candidatus Kaiserbacteria bacterium RIFCSPLOWO2_01_FULL_54_13]|uniref:Uncharacterized protein n=1 Tax=Candidatus Kaiserbacteria bacterium RIFCSPLOWO2_01_FULL_54_13 TaxID=1798512 RepID=A0A1F6F267_9BACT|nr:MAG: hypothetical protein A3A39_01060 [Candidatus Kaiserbacteria bacterium RIFCSPLOWO2_01_FULL_54_13]